MQFFLDTASLDAIRRWQDFGLVDGCTTNPALLAKEGGEPLRQLANVAELVRGPVSAQVTLSDAAGMARQGRALAELAPNIDVKVPATQPGFAAARELTDSGCRVNVTLAFQPAQALPFARIPVAYVSLILGRIEDFGHSSLHEVEIARELFTRLKTPTKLLVASLRNPTQLCAAIAGGADVVTVPPSTWELVYANPLSLQGERDFAAAWSSLPEALREPYDELAA
jgi:transaldolase